MFTGRIIRSFVVLTALSAVVSSAVGGVPVWRCLDGRPCPLTAGAMPWHGPAEAAAVAAPVVDEAAVRTTCCKSQAKAVEEPVAVIAAPPMRCVLVADGVVSYTQVRAGDLKVSVEWAAGPVAWLPVETGSGVSEASYPAEVGARVSPVGWMLVACVGARAPPVV